MGMPVITPGNVTQEQAVTNLITSIAMQENAISHIINAEGEKMQEIIGDEQVTRDQLFKLNKTAELMITTITRLEMILQAKLELAVSPVFATSNIGNGQCEGE